jgi:hypothetical protein
MPDDNLDEQLTRLFYGLASAEHEEPAPSRLKSRAYSALIHAQQETGPLQTLTESEAAGHGLCIFEKLVQVAPIGERAKAPFICWTCHARILAEHMESAPIYWSNCPYAGFQNR